MAGKSILKKYKKEDLTILWEPKKCIHSAICVQELPGVYDPNAKPWIKPENASVDELKAQINKCPSGALSYEIEKINIKDKNISIEVELMRNGPLLVKGDVEIKSADGTVVKREKMTAFCRCGSSQNKPYCDGTHKKIDFTG